MGRPINEKCQKCSEVSFRFMKEADRPSCYVASRCQRKRNYYRYLESKRRYQRRSHHYLRYSDTACAICQAEHDLEVHHINAQSNGGESTKTNCMTLCVACHRIITKYYQAIRGLNQTI